MLDNLSACFIVKAQGSFWLNSWILEQSVDGNWFLREVGLDFDNRRQLKVLADGVLWPSTASAAFNQVLGPREHEDVSARKANRTQGKAEGREGEGKRLIGEGSWGARAATSASQELGAAQVAGEISDYHANELAGALAAYQQFRVRLAPPGAWLSGKIRPIKGLPDNASIVMVYPFEPKYLIRGWAWWDCGVWVGPRHTNYGDGSICAFEPEDSTGVWRPGDPLVQLLDYWAAWVGRQIFLKHTGRWPGSQSLHTALERLNEHSAGELCGGCGSGKLYEACCRTKDIALSDQTRRQEFDRRYPLSFRNPPRSLADCVRLALQVPVSIQYLRARQQLLARVPEPLTTRG